MPALAPASDEGVHVMAFHLIPFTFIPCDHGVQQRPVLCTVYVPSPCVYQTVYMRHTAVESSALKCKARMLLPSCSSLEHFLKCLEKLLVKICLLTSLMPILGSSFQNRKYQPWILRVLVEPEMPQPHSCHCLFPLTRIRLLRAVKA